MQKEPSCQNVRLTDLDVEIYKTINTYAFSKVVISNIIMIIIKLIIILLCTLYSDHWTPSSKHQ